MSKKSKVIIFLISLFALSLMVNFVFAEGFEDPFGVENVNSAVNLETFDLREGIIRVINIGLSFLALIVLILIIYAGFLWMTSGGEEDKVRQAKSILKNALIGLVIILASWGITIFLLDKIMNVIGGGGLGGGGNNNGDLPGFGAIGACTVESFYPTLNQKDVPRNTSILITFKEQVELDNLCIKDNAPCPCNNGDCNKINPQVIKIFETTLGDACKTNPCPDPNTNISEVKIAVDSLDEPKTLILTPTNFLGSPTQNTDYTVLFTNDLKKKLDGKSMFVTCGSDYFSWNFEVSTKLDLTPPQVVSGRVFPSPDNQKDTSQTTNAIAATAQILLSNSSPHTFTEASLESIDPNTGTISNLDNYHGSITKFQITVTQDSSKAQLFNDGNNQLLGIADFDAAGQIIFPNYFTFTAPNHEAGSAWVIKITPEQLADTLTVGPITYVFVTSGALENNIIVPAPYLREVQRDNIITTMSGHSDVIAEIGVQPHQLNLKARIAGVAGNSITLETTNPLVLGLTQFSGGVDRQENTTVNGKPDRPMNSVIQINFNEAINPLTVSGPASGVKNNLRVVNANAGAKGKDENCAADSDCLSYKCLNSKCEEDYLAGKFILSNGYRTVEFVSNNKCGVNGCGEEIYCLPANSNLRVELRAADLSECADNVACSALSPYNNCKDSLNGLGYSICQDSPDADSHNYPVADANNINGIVDVALNSLDGNRDTFADGPKNFYNENGIPPNPPDPAQKDSYQWSFFISDKIAIDPPVITGISPINAIGDVPLIEPVKVEFNSLMMGSTLRSGTLPVNTGTTTVIHHLINLWSAAPSPLGYWLSADNQDTNLDGEPDKTIAYINHSIFSQSMTFNAQVGSGVKDIYQNCFKPSAGPLCAATDVNPSCCFSSSTADLTPEGNCAE